MSIFDELQQAAAKHDPLNDIRSRIQALRDQTKALCNAMFAMDSEMSGKAATLQGRLDAFNECLQLFDDGADDAESQGSRSWADEE